MVRHWKLDGVALTGTNVKVLATGGGYSQDLKGRLADLHGANQDHQRVGVGKPIRELKFSLTGTGDKQAEIDAILGIIEVEPVWTLEAPDDGFSTVKAYLDEKRAAFSTLSITEDAGQGTNRTTLSIQAHIEGVWIADGGTYYETVNGYFTKTSSTVWTRDDGTATGTTPLVRLPQQSTGYPLALSNSTNTYTQPTLSGTAVVGGLTYGDYDFTGFLKPAPSADGDVGLYTVRSSPSSTFLAGP